MTIYNVKKIRHDKPTGKPLIVRRGDKYLSVLNKNIAYIQIYFEYINKINLNFILLGGFMKNLSKYEELIRIIMYFIILITGYIGFINNKEIMSVYIGVALLLIIIFRRYLAYKTFIRKTYLIPTIVSIVVMTATFIIYSKSEFQNKSFINFIFHNTFYLCIYFAVIFETLLYCYKIIFSLKKIKNDYD